MKGEKSRMNPRSRRAWSDFQARVQELGGTVLEPGWLGTGEPHRVLCAEGHECAPRPNSVQKGQGLCPTCAGNSPTAAEAAFRARLAELGGTLLEPQWLGSGKRTACSAPMATSARRARTTCRGGAGSADPVPGSTQPMPKQRSGPDSPNSAARSSN